MHIERLNTIQHDLEDTATHFDALSRMLQGHALYLRHSRLTNSSDDIDFIESRLNGLALSISDLRGVARNISKVA